MSAQVTALARKRRPRRMPVAFFGHASPTIALENNATTEAWAEIACSIPRPRAILCVSARWCTRGTAVTAMRQPNTLHDYGGYIDAMFEMRYPAPGDPGLARRVQELLAPEVPVRLDENWGLDHGAWSVLMKAYPKADIPVVELSLDVAQTPAGHYRIGQMLQPLRDEGVLIVGTGNVVRNNKLVHWNSAAPPYDWAMRFNDFVRESIARNERDKLINYALAGQDARLAVPSPDHYWPLLYVMGARSNDDQVSFGLNHIEHRSISMMTVVLNNQADAA